MGQPLIFSVVLAVVRLQILDVRQFALANRDLQDGLNVAGQLASRLGTEPLFPRGHLIGQPGAPLRDVAFDLQLLHLEIGGDAAVAFHILRAYHFDSGLLLAIEERHELVILALLDGIVFVIVALGAADRQAQKDRARGGHAVEQRLDAVLLLIHAAFLVDHGVAMEAGGDFLIERGVRQQVASQLLDRELIERHVAVERVDHPIAVMPHHARIVIAKSVGVGIARGVQPVAAPALAVMRRSQQAIHKAVICIRTAVGEKGVDLRGRGRQSDQVQAQAADQRGAIGFGRGRQVFLIEAREHEPVDGIARPRCVAHRGRWGTHRNLERPVVALRR